MTIALRNVSWFTVFLVTIVVFITTSVEPVTAAEQVAEMAAKQGIDSTPQTASNPRETTNATVAYPLLRQNFFGDNVLETIEPHAYGNGKFITETLDGETVYTCDARGGHLGNHDGGDDTHDGDHARREEIVPRYGVAWTLQLDQTHPAPIYFAAESQATEVSGGANSNYAIYADLVYDDGTVEWGVTVPFGVGTHDWQRIEKTFLPSKPIQSLTFYTLFRDHTGIVRFRRPEVRVTNFPNAPDFGFFDGIPVKFPSEPPQPQLTSIYMRDVTANSDWLQIAESSPKTEQDVLVEPNQAGSRQATPNSSVHKTPNTVSWQQESLQLQLELRQIVLPDESSNELTGTSNESAKVLNATNPLRKSRLYSIHLRNLSGTDRALTLVVPFRLPVDTQNVQWLPAPDQVIEIGRDDAQEYSLTTRTAAGVGRLGLWPMAGLRLEKTDTTDSLNGVTEQTEPANMTNHANTASVDGEYREYWIQMDPDAPAVSRIFYNAATRELCVAFDLGFSPEKSDAELRFRFIQQRWSNPSLSVPNANVPTHSPVEWAYRAEWQKSPFYIGIDRRRIAAQGLWMPFAAISKVPQPEDFGFRFKEGNDETDWDDAHHILTFRYTEPMTWWMSMQGVEKPWTLEKAIAEAERLAATGNRDAMAWKTSAMHDSNGQPIAQILDTPWCNGAVWSINSTPGIVGDATDYANKFGSNVVESLYGKSPSTPQTFVDQPEQTVGLDGEYIDSSEGYVTRELDCRRDHFAATQTPLTFENTTQQPAIFRGLVTYEYTKALADETHRRGKLLMANSTPSQLWWLAPKLDVLGTETNWNWGGKWQPMSIHEMVYRRALSGTNAYCYLQNTNFDLFTPNQIDRYMQRSVAFGFFPGFFSADASTGHYFSRPELFERDRPQFKKYMPVAQLLTQAGWEPVPMLQVEETEAEASVTQTPLNGKIDDHETPTATATTTAVQPLHIERFGRRLVDSEPTMDTTSTTTTSATDTGQQVESQREVDSLREDVVYWTLFNPNTDTNVTATLRFAESYTPRQVDILLGEPNGIQPNTLTPEPFHVTIPSESVVVLRATF